ncbi:two-component regulator propeller domain-containing protein [Arthrospiribacter ruber]|uniref:Hybrid sensor histidine kinase/response regulator n=1 Tax=Arthrospiribacter ruber TaxID=2487934 RepID=A0A951J056_9BACT|nr:two-component regulator propeller domain-containing protein [Arthrospiribacter ruber]MBW3466808.1 hybrid sensor histidine kinase/response regulator [Arthrospiribacter ruber]MBW3469600.1 hybrid sensor histidine kinase/response regulator [Arthrospiribacter ruber]MBW3470325.1 hybrid sensor histidine kinase/response regulator [Arthrospiribacter ruber]
MMDKASLLQRILFVYCTLLLISVPPSFSQQWNIVEKETVFVRADWNNSNELPVNTVFRTVQDQKGFVWMATEEGLVRFDGRSFKNFNHTNNPDIQTPTFNDLTASQSGGVYAANSNALVHASFNKLEVFNSPRELGPVRFTSIAETFSGEVYLGTQNGTLFLFHENEFKQVYRPDTLKTGYIRELEDFGDHLLLGGINGFFSFDKKTGKFHEYELLSGKDVKAILITPDREVYIGTRLHGLYLLKKGSLTKLELPAEGDLEEISALEYSTVDRSIWVGTSSQGIFKIKGKEIIRHPDLSKNLNEVWDIFEDDEGAIWTSGLGIGISRFSLSTFEILGENSGLSHPIILATMEDSKKGLWLGTPGGGLNRITSTGVQHFTTKEGLSHDLVLSLAQRDNEIFIGTGKGLNKINLNTLKIEKGFLDKPDLEEGVIYSLLKDSKNNIWIGSINGTLSKLALDGSLKTVQLNKELLNAKIIFGMEDSNGLLWFGTFGNGFFSINKKEEVIHFPVYDLAPSQMVTGILEDPEGDLWISTPDGLISFSNGQMHIFGKKNGFQFDGIFKMIPDDDGLVWMSGNHGVQSTSIKQLMELKKSKDENHRIAFRLFDKSDGLMNNEFNGGFHPAGWKLSSGLIVFPSMEGAVIINPKKIKEQRSLTPPYLESLNFENQELHLSEDIHVPAGVNFFNISYGNIEFDKPKSIRYTYRIKELGPQWIDNENRTRAYFTGLNPGKYEFQVKAEQFGVFSETTSLSFTIEAYYYQTIWFKILVILFVFIMGFGVRTLIINKRMKEELQQKIKLQTNDLHAKNETLIKAMAHLEKHNRLLEEVAWTQSHQFRGPLSKILGMVEVLKNYEKFKHIEKTKAEILNEIETSSKELDQILRKLNLKLEEHEAE